MVKRILFSSIATTLISIVVSLTGMAHAQAMSSPTANEVTDQIQAGLWQGANFDVVPGFGATSTSPSTKTASNPATTARTYVALGDSVAAGVGLTGGARVPTSEARCERTTEAYPYAVAAWTGLPLIHKACSGATTRDFYTRDWVPSPSLPAQLDAGFAGGTPQLITITSGANDIRWLGFLDNCNRRNCATPASTSVLNTSLKLLDGRLDKIFKQIQSRSANTPPLVIATGYYNPVSSTCNGITPSITPEEISWISSGIQRLNQTIQTASARYSYVRFAPVDFTGHDICSRDPWVQGLQSPRPFHPTATGQQVMAQSVIAAYSR